jgi:hypothetical protein
MYDFAKDCEDRAINIEFCCLSLALASAAAAATPDSKGYQDVNYCEHNKLE